jgi:ElaB/YqjD/DUF883 family membrane-anchored ribosome-binding protein
LRQYRWPIAGLGTLKTMEILMTSASVDALRDTATDAIHQVKRAAAPAIKQGKHQAGALIDQSGDFLDTANNEAADAAAQIGKRLVSYTKENPWTALLLAAGVGALLISAVRSIQSR